MLVFWYCVIMRKTTIMLTTIERVKAFLAKNNEDLSVVEDYLNDVIGGVSSFISGYTGRDFTTSVYEDAIITKRNVVGRVIVLPNSPVKSVQKI